MRINVTASRFSRAQELADLFALVDVSQLVSMLIDDLHAHERTAGRLRTAHVMPRPRVPRGRDNGHNGDGH